MQPRVFLDLALRGEAERRQVGDLAGLDFVQFVVAAQQEQGEGRAAIFLFADHGDRLDDLVQGHAEKFGHIGTGHLARRGDFLHGRRRGSARRGRGQCFGQFDVGGVIGIRAEGDVVFAGIGQHVEFMRTGAADRTGVGRDGAEFQAQAREDAAVGFIHVPVFALQVRRMRCGRNSRPSSGTRGRA